MGLEFVRASMDGILEAFPPVLVKWVLMKVGGGSQGLFRFPEYQLVLAEYPGFRIAVPPGPPRVYLRVSMFLRWREGH